MNTKSPEYVAHAMEAERLARVSQSAEERTAYERIAAVWRDLSSAERSVAVSVEAAPPEG